jgi:HKD family nuclease
MSLILHRPPEKSVLSDWYRRAFAEATELYMVTAYLTEWNATLQLNNGCGSFRLIVGKDFGITRKAACESVMKWLPRHRKSEFLVADLIDGFHPKALFWKSAKGRFAVIGSSNLTKAAFESNYEANYTAKMSAAEFASAKKWMRTIEAQSVVVSADWLSAYKEAKRRPSGGGKKKGQPAGLAPLKPLWLPKPHGSEAQVDIRRHQLRVFRRKRKGLFMLIERCAKGRVTSDEFYDQLPEHWSYELGDRLQGRGWERQGRSANFQELSQCLLRICSADDGDRDDVVRREIDNLKSTGNRARTAFLSELLCLELPKKYPVVNEPVETYLKRIQFKSPKGASEGAKYIDLAKKLRLTLLQNPDHPAKNIAELDAVIWLKYGKK